jgi:hypothetical protein
LEATTPKATLVAHHTEQDLRVDAAHATSHTTTKHVSRVDEVIAIIVAGFLSTLCVSTCSEVDTRVKGVG